MRGTNALKFCSRPTIDECDDDKVLLLLPCLLLFTFVGRPAVETSALVHRDPLQLIGPPPLFNPRSMQVTVTA